MKKIISVIIMIMACASMTAQEAEKRIRPESPAITRFSRYDEMPVSEYTGTPGISVPIYQISEDGLNFPITLSYHASGIKVDQQASWVGLGWDLSVGTLTQIINDECDFGTSIHGYSIERCLPDYPQETYGQGCFNKLPMRFRYPYNLDGIGWTPTLPVNPPKDKHFFTVVTDCYVPFNGDFTTRREKFFIDQGILCDSEPDIFKANFLGESIHFVIDWKTNQFVVLNKDGYKVSKTGNNWLITNPHGEKFHFTQKVETNTYNTSEGMSSRHDKTMVTWLLTKISTRNNKEIIIDYTTTAAITAPLNTTHTQREVHHLDTVGYGPDHSVSISYAWKLWGTKVSTSSSYEPHYFINKITFPKGHIDFTVSNRTDITESKKLDRVSVYNKLGKQIKSVFFSYDYYTENTGAGKRLKLLSLTHNDGSKHLFGYNTTALPPISSLSRDCWGYYNGHANSSLVPNPSRYHLPNWNWKTDNGNNMSANLAYTKAGVLTDITYPTGGKVNFEHELHTFDNYPQRVPDYLSDSSNTNVGISKGHGLRIRKISYKDKDDSLLKEVNYSYEGGKSILPKMLFYKYSATGLWVHLPSHFTCISTYIEEASITAHSAFNPLASLNGVGYNKVTRQITGAAETERVETTYHNRPDVVYFSCSSEAPVRSLPAFKNKQHPENGSIDSVKYYNGSNHAVKEEAYTYTNIVSPIYYGASVSGFNTYYAGKGGYYTENYPQHLIGYYPIFDIKTRLEKKETIDNSGDTPIIKTTDYTYDTGNRLKKVSESVSGTGANNSTTYTYPVRGVEAGSKMIELNRINDIVATTTINYSGTTTSYTKNNFTWDESASKLRLSSVEKRGSSTKPIIDKLQYEVFDANDNPVQVRGMDNVPTTYIWGYAKRYLIAEIRNATYAAVRAKLGSSVMNSLESASTPPSTNLVSLNNLRTDMPETQIVTYTHKPLVGIESITDERGVKTTYEYDDAGRLTCIKDHAGNIVEKTFYHASASIPLSRAESSKPYIRQTVKEGTVTYVEFSVPFDNVTNTLTFYIVLTNLYTGVKNTYYGGYNNGKRFLGTLPAAGYSVSVGIVGGEESESYSFTIR